MAHHLHFSVIPFHISLSLKNKTLERDDVGMTKLDRTRKDWNN